LCFSPACGFGARFAARAHCSLQQQGATAGASDRATKAYLPTSIFTTQRGSSAREGRPTRHSEGTVPAL
jgi:uncharacterized protein YcnI